MIIGGDDLSPGSVDILTKHFIFDKIFNLLLYDYTLDTLYHELNSLKKEVYETNYRFIFLHYDTEYYINKFQPGLTLYNLQQILKSLDIPNFFCLILTQQNLASLLTNLYKSDSTDIMPIDSISVIILNAYRPIAISSNLLNLNESLISKKYITLNNITRHHRRFLISELITHSLINDGIVSFSGIGSNDNNDKVIAPSDTIFDRCPTLIYPYPLTRSNDFWIINDIAARERVTNTVPDSYVLKNFIDSYSYMGCDYELFQLAFLHLVTETVFDYPTTFITEKSFKPIANKRPFIIVGAPGTIANLRELGFRTFSDFWDESYDTIIDPTQRMLAIITIIRFICNKSISELQDLCIQMQPVLNYNFDYYINSFNSSELLKLEQACIRNLTRYHDI